MEYRKPLIEFATLYFYVKMLSCKIKHKAHLLPSPLASCVNCWQGSWERCSTRPLGWCLYRPPWILTCVSYFCVSKKGEREEKKKRMMEKSIV